MTTQYDEVGERYASLQDLPAFDVEAPSLYAVLPNVKGLTVLDLACGLGRWTTALAERGAANIVGVDVSGAMIATAQGNLKSKSEELQKRINYLVADCSKPVVFDGAPFDLAIAVWYLNYAGSYDEQLKMWQTVFCNLKPGSSFVSIVPNAHDSMDEPLDGRYGYVVESIGKIPEGWKLKFTAKLQNDTVVFHDFHFRSEVYEKAAAEAGFVDFRWHDHTLPADERGQSGYWDVYEARPHFRIVCVKKPGGQHSLQVN